MPSKKSSGGGKEEAGKEKREFTTEELLARAYKPAQDAMKLHPFYRGKVEVSLKCPVRTFDDFAIWYTPGVAEPCKAIHKNRELVYEHTNKWNTVAVVSDGTRVLGLGNIGPEAGLPVMEGKALLYKYLGGVDAFPICINVTDPEKIIEVVKAIQPSFGGVNLEDIEQPKCFTVLDRLRAEAEIPVWHDDQQGTATIVVAGVLNAMKVVGKKLPAVGITLIGSGSANIAIGRLLLKAGADPKKLIFVDSHGILSQRRTELQEKYHEKWDMCLKTNAGGREGGIPEAMKGQDVTIAMSRPGPGVLKKEWVTAMANDAVVFSCANPIPEIWPWEAKEAGAKVVATGRSDFPNQVNNSLGFPGIFRGTLNVRAKTITDDMCIAAANELAKVAEEKGLSEDYIVPTMDEWEVFPREAAAVGMKAIELGLAKRKISRAELVHECTEIIKRAREITQDAMKKGFIAKAPI